MIADPANRWSAPDFNPPPAVVAAAEAAPQRLGPSVEELAAIEKAAHDEGFALGKAEGLAAAQKEVDALKQQLNGLLNTLAKPFAELDHEVAEALGRLAVRIAGELLQDAYHAEPERLASLVDALLGELADEEREVDVRLHPTDLALIGDGLRERALKLHADNTLSRGSVRLSTANVRIDGSLETRLASALAALRSEPEATP